MVKTLFHSTFQKAIRSTEERDKGLVVIYYYIWWQMQYTQTLSSYKNSEQILCCYANVTNQVQIARITNITNYNFERIIFPGQRLMFESMLNAQLEIYTFTTGDTTLLDKITCKWLRVNEEIKVESLTSS